MEREAFSFPSSRLAEIVTAVDKVGLASLVMGGNAVRYDGLSQSTVDLKLHLTSDAWEDLAA